MSAVAMAAAYTQRKKDKESGAAATATALIAALDLAALLSTADADAAAYGELQRSWKEKGMGAEEKAGIEATALAVPVGLGCALYLSEQVPAGTRRAQWLGGVLDMLAAVPSIVYGLFGYQFFAISLGLGFSILSGGLALALMVLPLMIRSAEQALRGVPMSYRQASEALSISRWGWVRRILVPQAAPGIAVGIILSIGRALAETAVLLFTAGYVLRQPDSLLDSGRALSVHIYDLAMNVPGGMPRAAATGLVLVAILAILNLLVRRWLRPAQGAWQ